MSIVIALLVLGLIIFVHELGHFTAAKFFKIPVSEFAIGMGPKVFSCDTKNTTYSLRAIPLGGFVNIEGMEEEDNVENGFSSKPAYARFIVLVAGVMMNFLLAFGVLFIFAYATGIYQPENSPIIGGIFRKGEEKEVLKIGDKVLNIDGINIKEWQDIGKAIANRKEPDFVDIEIQRENQILNKKISVIKGEDGKNYIGIVPKYKKIRPTILEATTLTLERGVEIVRETVFGLKMMITGKVKAKELTGPIGIIKVVGDVSKESNVGVLWLMALISINIGILNLLPLPALDGGRIVFVLLEMIGIKVNKKIEEKVHLVGIVLLLALIIFVSTNDIFNLTR